jgi:hypothetical protein
MQLIPFPEHADPIHDGLGSTVRMREGGDDDPTFVCFDGANQPIWQVTTENPEEEDPSYDVQIVWNPNAQRWALLI